jgi:hypothetical protein
LKLRCIDSYHHSDELLLEVLVVALPARHAMQDAVDDAGDEWDEADQEVGDFGVGCDCEDAVHYR